MAWLETRDGLLKLLQEIPLSDEEQAAIDGNVQALNRLLEGLKEVPTSAEAVLREQGSVGKRMLLMAPLA